MTNFEKLAAMGRPIFLGYSQEKMIARFHLRADPDFLFVPFFDSVYRIARETGQVWTEQMQPASPAACLTIYDMLCRHEPLPELAHSWRTTNTLPGTAQSNPSDVRLNRAAAQTFSENPAALCRACQNLGGKRFPVGDVAYEFLVFPWFPVVFQLFLGDEEFPSSLQFLWDAYALQFLHYETLYYVMDCLIAGLRTQIEKPLS